MLAAHVTRRARAVGSGSAGSLQCAYELTLVHARTAFDAGPAGALQQLVLRQVGEAPGGARAAPARASPRGPRATRSRATTRGPGRRAHRRGALLALHTVHLRPELRELVAAHRPPHLREHLAFFFLHVVLDAFDDRPQRGLVAPGDLRQLPLHLGVLVLGFV